MTCSAVNNLNRTPLAHLHPFLETSRGIRAAWWYSRLASEGPDGEWFALNRRPPRDALATHAPPLWPGLKGTPVPAAKAPEPFLARGILRMLSSKDQTLTETQFKEACGTGVPKRKLKERLEELISIRLLASEEKGGREWYSPGPEATLPLLRFVRDHMPENARLQGSEALFLIGLLLDSTSVVGEKTDWLQQGADHQLGRREDRVLSKIRALADEAPGGRVKIADLITELKFKHSAQVAEPLRRLARAGRIVLDPLRNTMGIPARERSMAVQVPGKGMMFYVSLSAAYRESLRKKTKK